MKNINKKPAIKDIAAKAGVAISTVSHGNKQFLDTIGTGG